MPYDYILVCIDRGYAGASDKADIFRSAPRRYVGSARPKEPVGREPTLVRFEVRHEKASDQWHWGPGISRPTVSLSTLRQDYSSRNLNGIRLSETGILQTLPQAILNQEWQARKI